MNSTVFAFGGFRLDAARRMLFDANGEAVPLNSRALDTLAFFVEHPQQLHDKATLLATIWPHTVVEDNNLNQCIWALRRALGESPGEHRFIVTVPGRGYRFVAAVEILTVAGPDATTPAPTPAWEVRAISIGALLLLAAVIGLTARRPDRGPPLGTPTVAVAPSLAVLPFMDLSEAKDEGRLADELARELLSHFASHTGLALVGRGASGADFLLEGTVRRSGGRLDITAQLIESRRGTRLWSDRFDRPLSDVPTIEEDIARGVATALGQRLQSVPKASTTLPGVPPATP